MNEGTLHTWQGIEAILHRMTDERREPEPWEAYFVTQAILSMARGKPNLSAIEKASLPVFKRHAHNIKLANVSKTTRAELRAAFEMLPVPGGHPA